MNQFKKIFFIVALILSLFSYIDTKAQTQPLKPNEDVSGQTYYPQNDPNYTNSQNVKTTADIEGGVTFSDGTGIPLTDQNDPRIRNSGPDASLFPGGSENSEESAMLEQAMESVKVDETSQAATYDKKDQSNIAEAGKKEGVTGVATDVVGCSAGQILGSIISSAVSSAMTSALGYVAEKVTEVLYVPTKESGQVLLNSKTQSSAEVGTTVGAFGIGILALPSWNSIAYCVVNAMIEYVANSTIAWIQGGFEGNPSFVNNPEQFFKDLADVEASAFLKELAYGTLGLNICEPFRVQIVLTIARSHIGNQQAYGGQGGYSRGGFGGGGGANGYEYGGCTLDDIKGNLEGFLEGNFDNGGWDSWFQVSQIDSNNPYSTYLNLQAQLNGAISKKQNLASAELDWGKGFLSFRKCDEKTPKEKQKDCPITSPGVIIQGQLEKTLGLAKDRLVLAEKFDQVIAAVVNQLINTALDKVLEVVVE
ncbi:MAG: hypothetical protein V4686_02105 [Patescibacteria group bacterium]